jgi:methionyl-tRNA formyltransferase
MRVVFFGTPDFAVPSLEALLERGHNVACVVSQPDRPSGRRRQLAPPPVKVFAADRDVPVRQVERCNESAFLEELQSLAPEAIVVAAFGQKLGRRLLALPPHGCINVHASLLPRHRGAAPVAHAILAGDAETGVTIMQMVSRMDAGDILAQAAVPIGPKETAGELSDRLARLGGSLLVETLDGLEQGSVRPIPQDDGQATLAPSLRKSDGVIDWQAPAAHLERFVRAMRPWPGAYTFWAPPGKRPMRLVIHEADAVEAPATHPTRIAAADDTGLAVETSDGVLVIHTLQPAGKRVMDAGDFIRGHKVEVGSVMGWTEAAVRRP